MIFDCHSYAEDAIATAIFFACDELKVSANSVPLAMEEWKHQFEAWWDGWKEHWENKDKDVSDHTSQREETYIPAGESDEPDLNYRPPAKPAFSLAGSDAPLELLDPIHNFHSGVLKRDWRQMARAYPNFDISEEDRAVQLGEWYLSHDFGRWVYVRQVDSWWKERSRACVVVRGVEHTKIEDEPTENSETVLTYGLLKRANDWVISTWSQGWPQFGSAPTSNDLAPWRLEWDLP